MASRRRAASLLIVLSSFKALGTSLHSRNNEVGKRNAQLVHALYISFACSVRNPYRESSFTSNVLSAIQRIQWHL